MAGGISTLSHLKILKKLGVEGAIVGKALYSGNISLKKALAACLRSRCSSPPLTNNGTMVIEKVAAGTDRHSNYCIADIMVPRCAPVYA